MKNIIAGGIVGLLMAVAANTEGAFVYPFLEPVRSVIVTNIAAVTNRAELSPDERQQFRTLLLARNLLDRRTRASLVNDVQVFASVSTVLQRGFPDGDFDLLLSDALLQYRDVLIDTALTLGTNVSQLPDTASTRSAANTLANTTDLLEQIDTTAVTSAGTRSLVTAALRLRSVEAALTRLTDSGNGSAEFTARVNGEAFRAGPNGISMTYNPTAEFITITGREVFGIPSSSRTITLFIDGVTPGTTSRFFGPPATGTYATYSEQGVTNSATFTSVSGHVSVNLDARTGNVSARFSFQGVDALDRANIIRITSGNFSSQPR